MARVRVPLSGQHIKKTLSFEGLAYTPSHRLHRVSERHYDGEAGIRGSGLLFRRAIRGQPVIGSVIGEAGDIAAIGVHAVDFTVAVALALKNNADWRQGTVLRDE